MKKLILLGVVVGALVVGCTENVRVRNWGGSQTINLPPGQKLQMVTFKNVDMWYLHRPMRTNEVPETWTFKEKSNFGAFEGTVTFVESR